MSSTSISDAKYTCVYIATLYMYDICVLILLYKSEWSKKQRSSVTASPRCARRWWYSVYLLH